MARSVARIVLAVVVLVVAAAGAQDAVKDAVKDDVKDAAPQGETAVELAQQVYEGCLQRGSLACVRPRLMAFLSEAAKRDGAVRITRDLSIVPSGQHAELDSNALDSGDSQVSLILEQWSYRCP